MAMADVLGWKQTATVRHETEGEGGKRRREAHIGEERSRGTVRGLQGVGRETT
jgi:hypothetical protein